MNDNDIKAIVVLKDNNGYYFADIPNCMKNYPYKYFKSEQKAYNCLNAHMRGWVRNSIIERRKKSKCPFIAF